MTLTVTYNLDLQSPASYDFPYPFTTDMHILLGQPWVQSCDSEASAVVMTVITLIYKLFPIKNIAVIKVEISDSLTNCNE